MTTPTGSGFIAVFREVITILESRNLPYMVVGSIASIVYGEPRMTRDTDLVIDIPPTEAGTFATYFSEDHFYIPPPEALRDEIVRRGQFNLIHPESGLKIDVIVRRNGEHALAEFARKKHLTDIRGILANTHVDHAYLDLWVGKLGLTAQFEGVYSAPRKG